MKVRSLVFLLALLLTVVLWPNRELTASTYYDPPVCEAFNLAKAVFIGRVVNASQKREYVYKEIKDDDIKSFQTRSGKTDAEGKYKIDKVDPGRYLLGVNVTRPTPQSPYPRIFYPDVSDIKQAEVITVEPEKKTGPFDLRLTQTLEKRTIQGIVLWPDDTPVVGANISLRDLEESLRKGYEATTDEQGRFTVEGLRDYEYELQVYWRNKNEKAADGINKSPLGWTSATSEAEKLKVTDNVKDLKIVLSKQW